jgi:hypothetical protein
VNPELLNQLGPLVFKAVVGIILTGLLGVIMWPFRRARKEWVALKDDISATHKELVQQRTNCLSTLQQQGEKQVELLEKTVEVLNGVRIELATQTGYLSAAQPVLRRRAVAKK